MNKPKQRVENQVDNLFIAFNRLVRTIENNYSHLNSEDLQKIINAIEIKVQDSINLIKSPPSEFKLEE